LGSEVTPPADEEAEAQPESEPDIEPRCILMNSNVPCAVLLHHARKTYIKVCIFDRVATFEGGSFYDV